MGEKLPFILWQGHLQAFFMGLLFFLAGTFADRSLRRQGTGRFVRERLFRLGIPALLYLFIIHPLVVYGILGHPQVPDRPSLAMLYLKYIHSGRVLHGSGPLWFALALLFFSLGFAGWRKLRPMTDGNAAAPAPGVGALFTWGGGLVLSTFAVRLIQPIGTHVLNFQLGFFPQYIAGFAAGVFAGRRGWLVALAESRRARIAGWIGIIGGPVLLGTVIQMGGPLTNDGPNLYFGGWSGQAFGLALWEQLSGLALGLGALSYFARRWSDETPITRWLAEHSFAVFVLHTPVLVVLTLLLRVVKGGPLLLSGLLTVLGLLSSFAVAALVRRIPGVRAVL